jgi:hypothetical protein
MKWLIVVWVANVIGGGVKQGVEEKTFTDRVSCQQYTSRQYESLKSHAAQILADTINDSAVRQLDRGLHVYISRCMRQDDFDRAHRTPERTIGLDHESAVKMAFIIAEEMKAQWPHQAPADNWDEKIQKRKAEEPTLEEWKRQFYRDNPNIANEVAPRQDYQFKPYASTATKEPTPDPFSASPMLSPPTMDLPFGSLW